jgi:transglutaminase-like putative cysteine protease
LIQSDNDEIINLAKDITEPARDRLEAVQLINRWVFKNIRIELSPDISNAYQTLKTGRGDCGEHTALTIALLRAAGIPARGLGGLAYVPSEGGFGYHAWVEAYVGKWIQIDPTWGEENADAANIALARGNLKDMTVGILGSMNKIRIQIVSMR